MNNEPDTSVFLGLTVGQSATLKEDDCFGSTVSVVVLKIHKGGNVMVQDGNMTREVSARNLRPNNAWLDAGAVAPSMKRYRITWPHEHKTLRVGDVVEMIETPLREHMLLRFPDMTEHRLQDDSGQYVHLIDCMGTP